MSTGVTNRTEQEGERLGEDIVAGRSRLMFSPASFFDVIDSVRPDSIGELAEPAVVPQRPATVALSYCQMLWMRFLNRRILYPTG